MDSGLQHVLGIGSLLLAFPLFVSAAFWLLITWMTAIDLPIAYFAGSFQIAVSILFALSGVLSLRKSRYAKIALSIAAAGFVIDILIAGFAFTQIVLHADQMNA